jgi:hypothetical protein
VSGVLEALLRCTAPAARIGVIVRRAVHRPPVGVTYGIYRSRNARTLTRILRDPQQRGWSVHLWALDEVHPLLAAWTDGSGPGPKFELLNRLLAVAPPNADEWIAFVDDDISFRAGGISCLLAAAQHAGLDLAQAAHASARNAAHPVTVAVPGAFARSTTFVEIGPFFVISPAVRERVVPFPMDAGMGWGLEFEWRLLRDHGYRLGVIDAVELDHLAPVAASYSGTDAMADMDRWLEERGHADLEWRGETITTWWAHRGRPASW